MELKLICSSEKGIERSLAVEQVVDEDRNRCPPQMRGVERHQVLLPEEQLGLVLVRQSEVPIQGWRKVHIL